MHSVILTLPTKVKLQTRFGLPTSYSNVQFTVAHASKLAPAITWLNRSFVGHRGCSCQPLKLEQRPLVILHLI